MKKMVMEKELCVISPISVHKMKKVVMEKELCVISPISGGFQLHMLTRLSCSCLNLVYLEGLRAYSLVVGLKEDLIKIIVESNWKLTLRDCTSVAVREPKRKQESYRSPTSISFTSLNSGLMPKRRRNGFGRKETDEEHPHVCRKRNSKQVAATLDSAVEPQRSSRSRGSSSRRNNRSEKLNSTDFERYMETIWSKLPEDKKNSFECLDSVWFSSYTTKLFKPKVLSWIKNIDIFSKKYVFVPIVLWDHWCLLIFCHLGESLESESPTPCMLLLDSLQMADPLRFEPEIRKFVSDIFTIEERPESQELINKIQLLVPKVPQQRNDTDCGRFVLYYLHLFLESAPETFSISEGYPYFMKRKWFTPGQLKSFWQKLQSETKEPSPDRSFSGSDDVTFIGIEYESESDM